MNFRRKDHYTQNGILPKCFGKNYNKPAGYIGAPCQPTVHFCKGKNNQKAFHILDAVNRRLTARQPFDVYYRKINYKN